MSTERAQIRGHLQVMVWLLLAATTVTPAREKFAFHRPVPQPGKQLLAFTMECHGKHEIATERRDGSDMRRLTSNDVEDWHPRWSPDGRKLVFFRGETVDGEGRYDIVQYDLPSGEETVLVSTGSYEGDPVYTPDGSRIVFNSNRNGNHDLFVMNSDGTGVTRLTENSGSDHSAAVDPSGRWIVYVSQREGIYELHRMKLDGNDDVKLPVGREENYKPDWSSDGKRLVFFGPAEMPPPTSGRRNFDIFRLDLAKSKLTRLTYEPSFEGDAVWSGGRILFTSDRRGQSEIFAMRADGSKPQALFDSQALEALRKACSSW